MILERIITGFKNLFIQDTTRPNVKKASDYINAKSHKQKKYISLMLVPSYSTGKTRSLRIPRAVFHGVVISALVITAVVMGFYLRSDYFARMAQNLNMSLEETQEAFAEFQEVTGQVQSELQRAAANIYEQLSEEQIRAQTEIDRREREHQYVLDDIWEKVDTLEDMIRYFNESRQRVIEGLGARSIIPPVADLLNQLEVSQEAILSLSRLDELNDYAIPVAVGFLGMGGYTSRANITESQLMDRLELLMQELELQRELLDSLEQYRERMNPHLANHPTLWPIRGRISSGFGWRQNPMGGRGSEHHDGIDIPARTGTPIRATGGGVVISSGWRTGYGNTVVIDHGNGITTLYAHNSRNRAEVGQRVERGDIIAYVGSTGRSTGPHVHYEVRINGRAVNPITFLLEHHS